MFRSQTERIPGMLKNSRKLIGAQQLIFAFVQFNGWMVELEPLDLGRLRPEWLTSNQMASLSQ